MLNDRILRRFFKTSLFLAKVKFAREEAILALFSPNIHAETF